MQVELIERIQGALDPEFIDLHPHKSAHLQESIETGVSSLPYLDHELPHRIFSLLAGGIAGEKSTLFGGRGTRWRRRGIGGI